MAFLLKALAVLLALRGTANLFKPFGAGSALVILGRTLPVTSPLGPIIGLWMIAFAVGILLRKRWAVPLGMAYAAFATLNIILFPIVSGLGDLPVWFYVLFTIGGIAAPWAAVILLQRELARGA